MPVLSPALTIDKPAPSNADEDGSGDVSVGDTLTYTITATNSGGARLTNVVVSDDLITRSGGTSPCATVVPGGTCTLIGTYVVTAADVTAGEIVNEATADSVQTPPVTDTVTVPVLTPSLTVVKTAPSNADEDGSGDVSVGDTLTYTITATNSGGARLTNVVVSDDLITRTGGTSPCATVVPGGTCTLIGTYVVTAADVTAGEIVNEATADSVQTPPVTDTVTVPVPAPALVIDKPDPVNGDEDGSGDVSVGDTLTYTITATNSGTSTLTNVTVVDDLITRTGGTAPCATVVPGGTCTLVGTYRVTAADVTAGQIVNEATADSVQTSPVTDTVTVPVLTPALAIDKPAPTNADEDGSGDVSVGDTLTYTITATNPGATSLTGLIVTDDLITPTGGTTPCATVAPAGSCTLIGTYQVTAADVTAGQIVNEATADSVQTPPVNDTVTVPVPAPALGLDKPVPVNADEDSSGDVSVGDTLTYTITATNTGTATLTDVAVSDDLITRTGGTSPCTTVAPGGTCTLIGTYVVTAADVTAGEIVNEATADSVQTPPVNDTVTVPVPAPTLGLDKPAPSNADEDGSGDVSVGDTLTYTITATNTGTATLTDVAVSDDLITRTGGTSPCTTVAPGGTCTLIGTYRVVAADVTAGEVVNEATADSDQTAPLTDTVTVPVPTPTLGIDKPAPSNGDEDGSGDVSVGDTLTYTITATNAGTATLTDVVVSDDLITRTGGTTPCTTVAPGGTCILIGTYRVTAADVVAGEIVNIATADSTQTPPVTDTVTVPVLTPGLSVDKPAPSNADEDGSGDVSVGDTLTYTVTATNTGQTTLTDVSVVDDLITPTGGTTPCTSVAPGATCTLIGTYRVTQADVTAGQIVNVATADSVQTPTVTDTVTVPVLTPGLSVDKPAPTNADEDGSGDVSVGDTLTYTITATNSGATTLTDLTVTDDLITPTGGTTPCATVAPGATCTLVGTYRVTAADVLTGAIVNIATADSTQTPPVTDTVTVPVATPTLTIDKPAPVNADEDGSGDVSVGDTLTYTITATNAGGAALTNVVVSDDQITPTGGSTPCALVAQGGTCTLVGTYRVVAADVTAGEIVNIATADSDQTVSVTDTVTVPVLAPALAVDKLAPVNADEDGSGDVSVGDTLTYTITATNTGTTNLTNVTVVDDLITRTGGTAPCALVVPGGTCTLVGTHQVTAADVTAGEIVNVATADSTQTPPVTDSETTPLAAPRLRVDKSDPTNADEDGSGDITVGDTLTYTITATNTGAATLTNLTVVDDLITRTGGTAPCAVVAPGGTCTLVGTYQVAAADVTAGQIVNVATADSVQTPSVTDTVTTVLELPQLSVDKPVPTNADQDGSADVSVGDTLTYTITATNNGATNLTNVTVIDDLITRTGGTAPCAVVAPGATCTLVGTYRVTAADVTAGEIVNEATADSVQTPPSTDDVTVPVLTPELSIDKPAPANADEDGSGDVSVGDTLTYTITATNTGAATLTAVIVTDDLITPTGGTTPCTTVAPGGACTLIGIYVVVAADVTAGEILNEATADSDQTAPVTDTVTVPVLAPELSVDKSAPTNADEDGSGDVSVGDTLTYTITATNTGAATLTDVVVTDDLITPTGGTNPCTTVAPGGTCTLIGTHRVTSADVTTGEIVNVATADSDQTPPVTDSVTTPLPSPRLAIDKPAPTNADEDGSGDVSVGDTLTYTITATNTGSATLTNVTVVDDLITATGGTTPCAAVSAGGICTLIGTYVVSPSDLVAGEIVNVATADSDQTPLQSDTETVPLAVPALGIDKPAPVNADEDGSGDVSVGDTLTYTITATNTGATNLSNVTVVDDLITPTGGSTPCALVAPGSTCTLVGTYVVTPADVAAGEIINEATADSTQTPPVTDSETTPLADPRLLVAKSDPANADEDGSGDITVGDTLTYTITATNTGAATLTNVTVVDDLITTTGGTAPCATVASGATCTLIGTYVVTPADVVAGEIVNVATADSTQTPPVRDTVTTRLELPQLSVDKPVPTNADQDGSGDVSVGDTLTYTITATNNGATNLTNVTVVDDLITPTGGTAPCATVIPGGTCTLIGTYQVTAADVTAGAIANEATADSVQTPPSTDDVTVPVLTPELSIDKPMPANADEDGSGDVSVGDTLTYTITATNSGAATLTDVIVTDDLITSTGGTAPCATVTSGGTCTLVGTYRVTAADVSAGQIVNVATADSVQTPAVTDTVTVPVLTPALSIDKPTPANVDEDVSGDVSVGDTLTYTITATNTGAATLTDVVVTDDAITPTGGTTPCATLAPGATCTLVGTYLVGASDVAAGEIVNIATADSDQTGPATDTVTVPLPAPTLVVDKPTPVNADEDGSGDVSVGDTLTYTITATNTGAATLTGLTITDDVIAATGGTTPCSTVAPGETCTLIGTYLVTAVDVTAGAIVNVATADSVQTPPVTDTVTVPVGAAQLAVDKPAPVNADEDGSGDVSVGDTLTYTITATNNGATNLTSVTVVDDLITTTGGTAPCATVVPGGTCTLVGTYVVTAADITAGEIVNVAIADSTQTPPATDTVTVSLELPQLRVDKPAPVNADEDGSGDVSVGDTLTYTITATNNGATNLTSVTVVDDLITTTGGTAPCATVVPGGTCTLVGTYVVTVADITAGEIVNVAIADSTQTPPATDTVTVSLELPQLSVDKPAPVNADEDGSGDVSVGDTLTYTITATNNGATNLTSVTVVDDLITTTGGTAPCATVVPGGTCTLVGTYVVTVADITAGEIVNEATADSTQTPPATDQQTTPVLAPVLIVDKPAPTNADEDGSGDVSVGDTLTYTITATNSGTSALTDVVVSDDLITETGGSTPCTSVLPGGTCTLVGTYVVTPANVIAGEILNTATADSDQTPPASDDVRVVVPRPALTVDKPAPTNADDDGSGDISEGDTLTYTITVTNTGGGALTNVTVADPMLTATGGTTPCALVAPGGTCTLQGTYVVTEADAIAGSITNIATGDSTQTPPSTDTITVPVTPLVADLQVAKAAPVNADEDGSGDVSVGDTLTYTITATNTGRAALTNVVVTDDLIDLTGGTTPCPTVPRGGTCTLIGTYEVTPADVVAGEIVNLASADSNETPPATTERTTPVPAPSVTVTKPAPVNADQDGSGDVSVGDTLTYTITATNTGSAVLTDVVVSDDLVTRTGGSSPCALVAPGETCTLIGTYTVAAADEANGEVVNVATVDSPQTPPRTTERRTPVPNPGLAIEKPAPANADEDASGDVSVGDTLTYTITATNTGSAVLTAVTVSDPLLTRTGGTAPCATVAPGGTCTLVGTYEVTADDVTAGEIENTATADSDQTPPAITTRTTPLPTPAITIVKPEPVNADEDGSGAPTVGDTLTYTITATNTGTAVLTNVVVSDPLITATGGTTPCTTLAPGASCTLIGTHELTPADLAAGSFLNTADVTTDQTPRSTATQRVDLVESDLSITKAVPVNADEDNSGDVSVGDTLTYTITATNIGPANLTGVTVTDPLITPTGGTAPCSVVAPGATCTLVGTYVVTVGDVTAGRIDNTATADSIQTPPVSADRTTVVLSPALTVTKPLPVNADQDGSGDVSVGDTLTYTITATASGGANLTDVTLLDPLITRTGGTSPCALVTAGNICTLIGTYTVTEADITAGSIDNVATGDSVQTPPGTDGVTVPVPTPALGVVKGAPVNADEDGSGDVSVGDTLTYTVTATNTGSSALTDVVVSDPLVTRNGGSSPCARVVPGATCTLVGTYVVTAADAAAGVVSNTATADSRQTPPTGTTVVTPVPAAGLALDKPVPTNTDEDGSGDVSIGDTLTYTITATNSGAANLTNVTISDPLLARTGGSTPCALLRSGQTCTLIGTYTVGSADVIAGQVTNTAVGDSDQTPPVTDDVTVPVASAVLVIDKPTPTNLDEDGSGDVSAGDTLTYTVTATNLGDGVLTNVVVTDPLLTRNGGTSPCASVAPNGTCTLVGTYEVTTADVADGEILNTATVDSTQTPPVETRRRTPVAQPALVVDKPAPTNADEDGSGDVSQGDTLTYTVTATNTGGAFLTNVVVSDPLLTPTGGSTPCDRVAPAGTCTLVGTYVVTAADVVTGTVANIATADSDQTPPATDQVNVPLGGARR